MMQPIHRPTDNGWGVAVVVAAVGVCLVLCRGCDDRVENVPAETTSGLMVGPNGAAIEIGDGIGIDPATGQVVVGPSL